MASNDELTARQLYQLFQEEYPDLNVSMSTIKRARHELGWIGKKTRYCALVSEANKVERLEWCRKQLENGE